MGCSSTKESNNYPHRKYEKINGTYAHEFITSHSYEEILRKHCGLMGINLKFPVRDKKSLGLVYTPGVAAPCKEIQSDILKSYSYTNRLNSMLLITDCSSLKKDNKWNNDASMPYLEAFCLSYKLLANIDCYPIIFNSDLVENSEEFSETIFAISESFSAVEFFGISKSRIDDFKNYFSKKNPKENKFCWLNGSHRKELTQKLGMNSSFIFAAIFRSLLDAQVYVDGNFILEEILKNLDTKNLQNMNLLDKTFTVLQNSAKIIFSKLNEKNENFFSINTKENNINNSELTERYILNKFHSFVIEGPNAWVNCFPNDYISEKNPNDKNALLLHARYKGVIQTDSKILIKDVNIIEELFSFENLETISNIILQNPTEVYKLTCKSNLGAIITNGTAILGLGDIGAVAGQPVMEGKSLLFKLYGGTDIIPICIQEKDQEKFVKHVHRITSGFSIINLEDIKAPQCFYIEENLNKVVDYPVFHDDQHGTAVVVLAGIINALKLKKNTNKDIKIVMNGAGAAGLSVTQLLMNYGLTNFIVCDTEGAIYKGRPNNMNEHKNKLAEKTNKNSEKGKLEEILKGAEIFIGLSAKGALTKDMIKGMSKNPIIFALANPEPEIYPNEALESGAFIVATGRSDFPNQINNSLAFPGIFRAAVDVKAKNITTEMKVAASIAIASLVPEDELRSDYIMPGALDTNVTIAVAKAVALTALNSGEAKNDEMNMDLIEQNCEYWFSEGKLINFDYIKKINLKY